MQQLWLGHCQQLGLSHYQQQWLPLQTPLLLLAWERDCSNSSRGLRATAAAVAAAGDGCEQQKQQQSHWRPEAEGVGAGVVAAGVVAVALVPLAYVMMMATYCRQSSTTDHHHSFL